MGEGNGGEVRDGVRVQVRRGQGESLDKEKGQDRQYNYEQNDPQNTRPADLN